MMMIYIYIQLDRFFLSRRRGSNIAEAVVPTESVPCYMPYALLSPRIYYYYCHHSKAATLPIFYFIYMPQMVSMYLEPIECLHTKAITYTVYI